MKRHLRTVTLFACIAAASALAGQSAFADYGFGDPGRMGGQHEKHKGHRGGMHFKRMARELNLSDQQKEQARTLFEKKRAEHKPLLEALRAEKRQLQTLVHSGSADEAAIRAQTAKVAAIQSDLAVQRGEHAKEFLALLTAEQAAKFKELQKTRRGFRGGASPDAPR